MYKVLLPGEALIDSFEENNKIIKKVGGAPLNVCGAINKFNVPSYFIGTIGHDEHGKLIEKILTKYGIGLEGLIKINKKTTIANVKLDSSGERSFTFERGADEHLKFSLISKDLLNDFQILHLGSATAMLGGELWNTYIKLSELASDKIIIFDPNYREALYKLKKDIFIKRSKFLIAKSDIVKVSSEELELLTKEKNIEIAAQKLIELGAKIILVTLGKKGTFYFSKDYKKIVPSILVKQIDTTGAGDAFIGYVIGQLAANNINKYNINNDLMLKYIRKANICASITVTKYGALESIPKKELVEKIHRENPWD